MEDINPKVFICHASEDKEKFVLGFGTKLRSKGVDAWVDEWEMHPGDSLVNKIFEEGIGQSDVVIVILSEYSINKKWVTEELNSATLRRIEEGVRIIPVIINDGIKVPVSLNHLIQVPITDLDNYDEEFSKILMAIYNMDKRPTLGEIPEYVNFHTVPGLTTIDSIVLKAIGDVYLKKGYGSVLTSNEIIERLESSDISKEDIVDSIEILGSSLFLNISHTSGGKEHSILMVNPYGLMIYCQNFVPNFVEQHKNVVSAIMNYKLKDADQIVSQTGYPEAIVKGILKYHGDLSHLKYVGSSDGSIHIYDIPPTGKRYFKEILES